MPAGARLLPRGWPGPRGWRGAAAAGLAALLVGACATVPDSGSAQAGKVALTAGGQGQDYLQLIPVTPQPGWTAAQVVQGFLVACASFANNHAIARQYLDPAVRRKWSPGWAVTVVGATRLGTPQNFFSHQAPSPEMDVVRVTGEKLATLTATGQYVGTQGPSTSTHRFRLVKLGGQWRIQNPPGQLLLTEPDFKRVYAPRNLYYVAGSGRALVPDPVFVPLQATSADLAGKLVTALLQAPKGWLAGGVSTAFPPRTTLRRVALNDGTATIDLGGPAARATQPELSHMTSQLAWTLAGRPYGQSAIQSLRLEINGRLRRSASMSGGQPRLNGGSGLSVPAARSDVPLYSVAATGAIQKLTGPALAARDVPGEAGEGHVHLTTIAASPSGRYVAGFSASRKVVYYGRIQRGAGLTAWRPRPYGGSVASLSWDARDELWVASSQGIWMLTPRSGGKTKAVPVGLGLPNGSVSQLRIAPDGARVAMIVHGPGRSGSRLLLAAILRGPGGVDLGPTVSIGTDVTDPTHLAWYDADNLIVLSRSRTARQLWEVAVNGGSSSELITDSGTRSITAAGPAHPMAAGLAHGLLALEPSLNGNWVPHRGVFGSPVYPG